MRRKNLFTGLILSLTCLIGMVLLIGATWMRLKTRPQPPATNKILFQGITYVREVRLSPRPMVIHVISVNLREPGIAFLVTPGDPEIALPVEARTTTQFLDEFGVQIAVNGDGFTPLVFPQLPQLLSTPWRPGRSDRFRRLARNHLFH